jgi:integrase
MPRQPTGTVATITLADGTKAFHLRFRANGRRQREIVHERHQCDCGCDGDWTLPKARAELDTILARVTAGVWKPRETPPAATPRDPTFHEYASEWVMRWKAGEFGDPPEPATIADYVDWRLAHHVLPYFARHPLSRVDKRMCARFKADKVAERDELQHIIAAGAVLKNRNGNPRRPLSNRSIAMFIRLLGQILQQAVEDDLIPANPARGKHMRLAAEKPVRTFLELDELADLLQSATELDAGVGPTTTRAWALAHDGASPRQIADELGLAVPTAYYHLAKQPRTSGGHRRAIVAALAYGGLRIGEACSLRRRALRLHVSRMDVEDAKTPTGIREVDLTPTLVHEMTAHRAWMERAGHDVSANAHVFQSTACTPLRPEGVRRLIRTLAARTNTRREIAGLNPLPRVTPHTLRRTYISIMLLASSGDIEYVMAQVGHADAETTMRIYSQLLKRAKRDHGVAFDTLVNEARDAVLGSAPHPTEATGA